MVSFGVVWMWGAMALIVCGALVFLACFALGFVDQGKEGRSE